MFEGKLCDLIIKHEGLRLKPYHDSVGKLTIGVGRNLEDNGISREEALVLLNDDIHRCFGELSATVSNFSKIGYARQAVLIDMCFNLGITRFSKFELFIAAVERWDFAEASEEMIRSKWARQVGNRAYELSEIMKTGEWLDT